MKTISWLILPCSLWACSSFAQAPSTSPAGIPAQMVITIGHYYSQKPPVLTRGDLIVTQRYEPVPVSNLVPLRGDRAGLELFFLVDNCSSCEPSSKFDELRRFITSQPLTTAVGVAYIQSGRLEVAEFPTHDHARAIKALNPPAGSTPGNPYNALTDLIQGWGRDASRHIVLMVSNGINPSTDAVIDPSAEAAIEAAQCAGVTVYAIYHPSADYATADHIKIYKGQSQLAHVADETGGEAYFLGAGPLPSLAPFLADISDHLANQYLLEFLASPGEPGKPQEVTIKSKMSDVPLMTPSRVCVAGGEAGSR